MQECPYLSCSVCCWEFWSVRWLTVHMCGLPLPRARCVHPHCCWCEPPAEREREIDSVHAENTDIKRKSLISQSVSLYEQQHFENDDLSNNSEQQSQVWMADIYTTQFSEWSFCWHCMDVSKQALESLPYNFSFTKRSEVLNLCILL